MLAKRIEEASLNAWPALQQLLFDGWILRFSQGYTKRANSVNPLFASHLDVAEKVTSCEWLYHEKGLLPIFRLTPFASPPDLDQFLAEHNYKHLDQTHVQYLNLKAQRLTVASSLDLRTETLDNWLAIFCQLSGVSIVQHRVHQEILQAIPSQRLFAVLTDAGHIVASGLGVLEQRHFGLFDLVTDGSRRNRGYGAQLVSCMLRWAQEHGAVHAYLQVLHSNAPARHLYGKLGFQEIYQYWYRVAND